MRHLTLFTAGVALYAASFAQAGSIGLTINATFDPSLTAADDGAITSAIATLEGDITSKNSVTVSIYFTTTTMGLGESITAPYTLSYLDYYNKYKSLATSANQLSALSSLMAAPTSQSSVNPVTDTTSIEVTSAEARNLGFSGDTGYVVVGSTDYDGEIELNTEITTPGTSDSSGSYGLQAVAAHEIDEVLGAGGAGTTLGTDSTAAGPLDLYRYSAPGVRSYTTSTSATSYFSINGGMTVLSYFNQTGGGSDYGDWASDPIPGGFAVQVQDAYATPGTNPVLGTNEITSLNVIGYELVTPEPSTFALICLALPGFWLLRRRRTRGGDKNAEPF